MFSNELFSKFPNVNLPNTRKYLMRPGFSVYKVGLLNTLQVLVLLQVLAHLHVFWVGLEVGVGSRRRLVGLLQLRRDGGKPSWWKGSEESHNLRTV